MHQSLKHRPLVEVLGFQNPDSFDDALGDEVGVDTVRVAENIISKGFRPALQAPEIFLVKIGTLVHVLYVFEERLHRPEFFRGVTGDLKHVLPNLAVRRTVLLLDIVWRQIE